MTNVHFSSEDMDWKTPEYVYDLLDGEFAFDFDPCPNEPDFDGLSVPWGRSNFVNPPYGREIGKWLLKGWLEARKGKVVVFLIPSRTDTEWWHRYCMDANEIRFVKGRIIFDGHDGQSAPFPSCVVIFSPDLERGDAPRISTLLLPKPTVF